MLKKKKYTERIGTYLQALDSLLPKIVKKVKKEAYLYITTIFRVYLEIKIVLVNGSEVNVTPSPRKGTLANHRIIDESSLRQPTKRFVQSSSWIE